MKNYFPLIFAAILLIFLSINFIFNHINGVRAERQWYISQLNYDFAGEIDSVNACPGNGLIFFHITKGEIDLSTEKKLKSHLKYNGLLDFILFSPENKTAISIFMASNYSPGDSLCVNTAKNTIRVYRDDSLLSESSIDDSMNGRPF